MSHVSAKWIQAMLAIGLISILVDSVSKSPPSYQFTRHNGHNLPKNHYKLPSNQRRKYYTWPGEKLKKYGSYVAYSTTTTTTKQPVVAYVHIRPAITPPPPPKRKCIRCMIVYKPCPPTPRVVGPRYEEPQRSWKGLMHGEFLCKYESHKGLMVNRRK
uniref:Secreted protein n=1 Tax=Bracon brevicornis TaxID=1563983 RepID=A0A6V7J7R4_9HYME